MRSDVESTTGPGRLLTIAEAAGLLGVSKRTLRRWRANSIVQALKFGRTVRFRTDDLLPRVSNFPDENSVT
jgi:excisionase family DNA binding protein